MNLIPPAAMLSVLLVVLWLPGLFTFILAKRTSLRMAAREMRVIWFCQLASAGVLALLADGIGLKNPAGYVTAITVLVSAAGAIAAYVRSTANPTFQTTASPPLN